MPACLDYRKIFDILLWILRYQKLVHCPKLQRLDNVNGWQTNQKHGACVRVKNVTLWKKHNCHIFPACHGHNWRLRCSTSGSHLTINHYRMKVSWRRDEIALSYDVKISSNGGTPIMYENVTDDHVIFPVYGEHEYRVHIQSKGKISLDHLWRRNTKL